MFVREQESPPIVLNRLYENITSYDALTNEFKYY